MSNKGPSLGDNKGPAANLVKKIFCTFDLKSCLLYRRYLKLIQNWIMLP